MDSLSCPSYKRLAQDSVYTTEGEASPCSDSVDGFLCGLTLHSFSPAETTDSSKDEEDKEKNGRDKNRLVLQGLTWVRQLCGAFYLCEAYLIVYSPPPPSPPPSPPPPPPPLLFLLHPPSYTKPKGSNILVKFQWLVEWPFSLLRWISIPPCDYVSVEFIST